MYMKQLAALVVALALLAAACGSDDEADVRATIESQESGDVEPAFDLLSSQVSIDDAELLFGSEVVGDAGSSTPQPAGALDGAPVLSYVWPTSLDSSIEIRLPSSRLGEPTDFSFDGVTSLLRVSTASGNPLLCVEEVFDVASGDLSLPGRFTR